MIYLKKFIVLMFILIFSFNNVQAQEATGTFSVGVFGGVGLPMWGDELDDFADDFREGVGFGGEFKYRFTKSTNVALNIIYQTLRPDFDRMKEEIEYETQGNGMVDGVDGTIALGIISASLVQYLYPTHFYITAGGGYYIHKNGEIKVTITQYGYSSEHAEKLESLNGFGLNGGLGFEMMIEKKVSLFVEGKYHYVFVKEEERNGGMGVKEKGEKSSFITIMAGLRIGL